MKDLDNKSKSIYSFPVLYAGWELDYNGDIHEDKSGKRHLILTSHGMPYVGDSSELREKIKEYQQVIAETQEAIRLLDEP